jgi:hypothetical protein
MSLRRLDQLLAAIRERAKPSREKLQETPQGRNFCSLLAFYVIEVLRRRTGTNIDWHDRASALLVLPEDAQLPDAPFARLIANSNDQGAAFMPLGWVESQVLDDGTQVEAGDYIASLIAQLERDGPVVWWAGMHALGRIASWQMMMAADGGAVLPMMLKSTAPNTWDVLMAVLPIEDVNEAVSRGGRNLDENREGASWQVLAYDGFMDMEGERLDAVMVILHTYGELPLKLKIAFPYRPARNDGSFAILDPRLREANVENDKVAMLNSAMERGIQSIKWAFGTTWNQLREVGGPSTPPHGTPDFKKPPFILEADDIDNDTSSKPQPPMILPVEQAEKLRSNAEQTRSILLEHTLIELNYDLESVRWLTGYIDRTRIQGDPKNRPGTTNMLGAYLGECLIRNIGGEWASYNNMVCVLFDDGDAVFPFNKVAKQLENGTEGGDSILSLYDSTVTMRALSKPLTTAQKRLLKFYRDDNNRIFIHNNMDGTIQ